MYLWQDLTINSDESCIVWLKSTLTINSNDVGGPLLSSLYKDYVVYIYINIYIYIYIYININAVYAYYIQVNVE